MEGKPYAVF
jgi:vacuolar protein sorting-associated protein 1